MPLAWWIALRFLREGRMQSLLIVGGAAVGVGVIVFLSALIDGLQTSLIKQTLGSQAHVVVRPADEEPRPVRPRGEGDGLVAARTERTIERTRTIAGYEAIIRRIADVPGVVAASPMASGPAFAERGGIEKSIVLMGVELERFERIIELRSKLRSGELRLNGPDVVIGTELAADLGVGPGDKLRVFTGEAASAVFTIAGTFDLGNKDVNRRWVLVSLHAGQSLLGLPGTATHIQVKVDDIFGADAIAARIAEREGLLAESWMKANAQLMVGLRSQSSSSTMIQVFVVIAVALGIASVLIVSVVQRSREIGIMKAMGISTAEVMRVFLIQGGLVGLLGSGIGVGIGTALALFFQTLAKNPDGSPTFPVALTLELVLRSAAIATCTGIASAVMPARRAARLDPAEVIRHG